MNFKNIVFATLLLAVQLGFSQSKINGKILDENNVPIQGANIIITNEASKNTGTSTDIEGNFSIQINESGTYNFRVTYIGYETYKKSIDISANQDLNLGSIVLMESTEFLQSVEVIGRKRKDYNSDYSFSATKVAIKNKELPQAVATVTKEHAIVMGSQSDWPR